jgi:hypothetical protein
MENDKRYLGTELKLNISIDPIGEYTMDDYDFEVELYCNPKKVAKIVKSSDSSKDTPSKYVKDEEGGGYIVLVDSKDIGTGKMKCKITAYIPDMDFYDGLRTEVAIIDTNITIV